MSTNLFTAPTTIVYWITANRDDFDIARFRSELPGEVKGRDDQAVLVSPQKDGESAYHALFGWSITQEEIELSVEYHAGGVGDLEGEEGGDIGGPPAEGLMAWLGRFFSTTSIISHAHARYTFPSHSRDATFDFALAKQPPHSARLYGVALQLPEKPEGIVSVRLTRSQSDWYAEIVGEREIVFSDFSPVSDSVVLEQFLANFLRKAEQ